jgi:hypothetical protein
VLPDNHGVLVEVRDVGSALALRILLEDHPAEMRVPETLANGVGVPFSIGVAVVSTVTRGPPSDGTLDGASADSSKVNLEGKSGLVARVSPKTVVTCRKATLVSNCASTSGNPEESPKHLG